MMKCKCGGLVANNARVCPKCGHRFTSTITMIIAAGFAVILGGAFIIPFLATDNSAPTTAVAPTPHSISTGNVANDRLTALSPQAQAYSLGKAAGEGCVGKRAFYMGTSPDDRSAFWSVGCKNGKSYLVQIHADATGSTQVLDCGVYKVVAKGNCFTKLAN